MKNDFTYTKGYQQKKSFLKRKDFDSKESAVALLITLWIPLLRISFHFFQRLLYMHLQ